MNNLNWRGNNINNFKQLYSVKQININSLLKKKIIDSSGKIKYSLIQRIKERADIVIISDTRHREDDIKAIKSAFDDFIIRGQGLKSDEFKRGGNIIMIKKNYL